jgi:N-acetylmuramic acid 6-phosphate etherase
MTRVLAFDVGKTGCRGAVFDGDARVTTAETSGGAGLAEEHGVASTVQAVTATARGLDAEGADLVVVGVAGFARAAHKAEELAAQLADRLDAAGLAGVAELALASDMTLAHAGALGGGPGVVVSAGTGAVALGVDRTGRWAVGDGWGYLLGDEGSGYAVGRAGLAGALRHHDGRGGSALLHRLATERYGDVGRLPALVHGSANVARDVAAFAADVRRAAEAGDEAAVTSWAEAGRALAHAVAGAARVLEHDDVVVTRVGGLFAAGTLLTEPFEAELAVVLPRARCVPAQGDALDGARLLARESTLPHEALVRRIRTAPTRKGARRAAPGTGATPYPHDEDLDARLHRLQTEAARADLADLDARATLDLVRTIAADDAGVPPAVADAAAAVAAAVDVVVDRLRGGGRLVYVGAGTSGRLAVLDAAELLPTYGVGGDQVVALIAGGSAAVTRSVEGAEDDKAAAEADLGEAAVSGRDVVVGITASGRTPYVLAAVELARRAGAATVGISNNPGSELSAAVDVPIEVLTGPEVVAGSTRMKAGTAQKLVLNTLSTAAMVRLGKVYGNRMVDMHATNEKLRRRARRIVAEVTGAGPDAVDSALTAADGHVKTAVVSLLAGVDSAQARDRLAHTRGSVRAALEGRDHA